VLCLRSVSLSLYTCFVVPGGDNSECLIVLSAVEELIHPLQHLAITFLCMSDHLVGDLPSVDFLAGQTILYVTSVALAIVLLVSFLRVQWRLSS
jgi:hypothetical protein